MIRLNLQFFASKKGVSSTKNGRDSESKRLGAKLSDGQFATAGSIIYRQRGTKVHPGNNVGLGKVKNKFLYILWNKLTIEHLKSIKCFYFSNEKVVMNCLLIV